MNYILKLSICISVVYLLYMLLFRRWTFYQLNRWYLLLFSVASFLIPLIDISPALEQSAFNQNQIVQFIPSINNYTIEQPIPTESNAFKVEYLYALIAVGIMACFVKLLIQLLSFRKLIRSASLVVDSHVKVYQVEKDIVPFSFGNSIFISHHEHSDRELTEIIRHEFIHVKQKHSVDIILSEIVCILNWYNPFAWLIRHAIRQNLEFIADEQVLMKGFDKKQYMYLLLKVIGINQYSIATSFNTASLKKRIAMMNKNKTARIHLVRTLCILPLLFIVLLAFRNSTELRSLHSTVMNDTIPKPAVPKAPNLPENVRSIHIRDNKATVRLKDGTVKHYDLSIQSEKAAYEKEYGPMPEAPEPPVPVVGAEAPEAPATSVAPAVPKEYNEFLKRNGSVKSVYVKDGNTMVLKLKNGLTEEYNLDDNEEFKAAVAKYGKLPVIAPPVPAAPNPPNPPAAPDPSGASVVSIEPMLATTVNIEQTPNVIVATRVQPALANTKNINPNVNVITTKPKVSVNTNINAVIAPAKVEKEVKQ